MNQPETDDKWFSAIFAEQMPAQFSALCGTPQTGKSFLSLELLRALSAEQTQKSE